MWLPRAASSSPPSLLAAGGSQKRLGVRRGAALAGHVDRHPLALAAERFAVLQQALGAAEKIELEPRNGDVRDRFEAGPQPCLDAVDVAEQSQIDLTLEI